MSQYWAAVRCNISSIDAAKQSPSTARHYQQVSGCDHLEGQADNIPEATHDGRWLKCCLLVVLLEPVKQQGAAECVGVIASACGYCALLQG